MAFVGNCLVKMTLRLFQSISVVMTMVQMFLRQFRRLAQGHGWSYANSLKQLILQLHLHEKTYLAVYYLVIGDASQVPVFFLTQIKMSNLFLPVGLMLTISEVFTILCLICLCGNREYPSNFQNKTVISKLFFQMNAQVK